MHHTPREACEYTQEENNYKQQAAFEFRLHGYFSDLQCSKMEAVADCMGQLRGQLRGQVRGPTGL